jgi:hypothetical protein
MYTVILNVCDRRDRATNLVDLKGLAGVTAQHHEYLHHDLSLCFWRAAGKARGSVSYVKRENKTNSTTCQRSRAKFPPICNYVGNYFAVYLIITANLQNLIVQ